MSSAGSARVPICPRPPPHDLPLPGSFVVHDFRSEQAKAEAQSRSADQPVRLLQWNIERGYKLKEIIEELQSLQPAPDILALQEIDIHCERSEWQDTGVAIAKALGMKYVFLCEFEELWSSVRDPDAQGGGVHGNAILSRFDLTGHTAVEHLHHPINWEAPEHPLCKKEPRHGRRLTLATTAATNHGPLLVYSAHLEVFCGMLARMRQFADIIAHSKAAEATGQAPRHQVIMGDLNTQANSLARLSPNYCTDQMRWLTLGWFEAEIWHKYIFGCKAESDPAHCNQWVLSRGIDQVTATAITNPGFSDPWHPRADTTIDLIKYRWFGLRLMTGKLDWLLTKDCEVVYKVMGNNDYDKSDHKYLIADVTLQ